MNLPLSAPTVSPGASRAWPRAFTHPGYWSALALLLVNDHLLKGAGLPFAPAWLTGKLSDVAGLLVAPALVALALTVTLPARLRRHVAIAPFVAAPVLVGLGFAAIKLDAGAARGVEAVLGMLGVPSRIWVDPGMGFFVICMDTENNVFAVWERAGKTK